MKKIMISALVASSLAFAGGDIAPVEPVVEAPAVVENTNTWQNEVTIYGWLPTINVDTRFGGGSGTPDAETIIDDLKMVLIGTYAVRHNKWSFITDVMYIDLGDSATIDNGTTVDMDIQSLLINAGVGYNLIQTDKGILDVVAGVRYMGLETDISTSHPVIPGKTASLSKDFVDGIIGVRGSYIIDENWYLPYYADIGTGDSDLTWQLFAGVGYDFDWGNVRLGYRAIGYEMEDGSLIDKLDMSGAILGVGIKF